ncbi:MAG: hypothetical protein IPH77_15805 [Ignavibacteria bacterium]|nr:hypothetical protein [Ignavibacteria bacterium]
MVAITPCLNISSTGLNASNRIVVKDLRVTGASGSANTGAGILIQSSVSFRDIMGTFENRIQS